MLFVNEGFAVMVSIFFPSLMCAPNAITNIQRLNTSTNAKTAEVIEPSVKNHRKVVNVRPSTPVQPKQRFQEYQGPNLSNLHTTFQSRNSSIIMGDDDDDDGWLFHWNRAYGRSQNILPEALSFGGPLFPRDGLMHGLPYDESISYTAVTDAHFSYIHKLYRQEWKSDPPSQYDPAITNALARWKICEDIGNSRVFARHGLQPVNLAGNQHVLNDPYTKRVFTVFQFYPEDDTKEPSPVHKEEHVFTCLLRSNDGDSESIVPFYVSKPYVRRGYGVHRFAFFQEDDNSSLQIMLAEESGVVFNAPLFNLEMYYLEMRKNNESETAEFTPNMDSVCKLNSDKLEDNQLFRLCTTVLTSSYFKKNIGVAYPRYERHKGWVNGTIVFKTEPALEKIVATNPVSERMVRCSAVMTDDKEKTFYISRAYKPNQVFVYSENPSQTDCEFYLEALVTGIHIVT